MSMLLLKSKIEELSTFKLLRIRMRRAVGEEYTKECAARCTKEEEGGGVVRRGGGVVDGVLSTAALLSTVNNRKSKDVYK